MKNLPLDSQTEISGYQFYIFPYTILHTCPEYANYLMEHYVQCFGYVADDLNHLNFGYADGVSYNDMAYGSAPLDIIYHPYAAGLQLDIRQYLISSIENENYTVIFVDEYHIEGRAAYKKQHRLHDILIYGYDEENFNYYVFDRRPVFSSFRQDQIADAYKSGHDIFVNSKIEERVSWINDKSIILMKPKPMHSPYNFSVGRLAEKLRPYLSGEFDAPYESFVISGQKCHIGAHNTKLIKNYVDDTAANFYVTYPAIHAWYESKRNLLGKFRYCYEKGNLANDKLIVDYETAVRQQAEKIRLSFLKYNRSGKLNRDGISALLDGIFNAEHDIVSDIYDELSHHGGKR